jgi:hypothetical protein
MPDWPKNPFSDSLMTPAHSPHKEWQVNLRCRQARITPFAPPSRQIPREDTVDGQISTPEAETADEGDKESSKSELAMPKTEHRTPHRAEEFLITSCRTRQKNIAQSASGTGYSTTGGSHSAWV